MIDINSTNATPLEQVFTFFSSRYQYLNVGKTLNLAHKQIINLLNEAIEDYMQMVSNSLLQKNSDIYHNHKRLSELDNLLIERNLPASSISGSRFVFSTLSILGTLYSYISFRAIGKDECGNPIDMGCKLLSSDDFDRLSNNSIYITSSTKEPLICIRNNQIEVFSNSNSIETLLVTYLCRPLMFSESDTHDFYGITNIKNIKAIIDIALSNAALSTNEPRWQATQIKQRNNPV